MIKMISEDNTFRSDTYREKIKTITLDDSITEPENTIESWDIGVNQNGDVMAFIASNSNDSSMCDLYIQGDGSYANPNSSNLFSDLYAVDSITGINKLNTSKVTNMSNMFKNTGSLSQVLTFNLGDKFDTSKVTNMNQMFEDMGANSDQLKLDLGNKFDTSKVTNMDTMFYRTAEKNNQLTLDLSTFDFSNVTKYKDIFGSMTTSQKIYVKNSSAQNWIINNSGNSNLTTSTVLVKN